MNIFLMTRKPMIVLLAVVGLLMTGLGSEAAAQAVTPGAPLVRRLSINGLYVREARDQAWHIRIMVPMSIPPGGYVIVYNERGDIVHHGGIPTGAYSPAAPYVVTVPADGVAQQYVVKLQSAIGNGAGWNRFNGPLPMTDLPFEVYAGYGRWGAELGLQGGTFNLFATGAAGEVKRIAFQVNPGVEKLSFKGGADLRILDDTGAVIGEKGTNAALALAVPQPGRVYWVDPGKANTFETAEKGPEKLYMTFDPERWFSPSLTWDMDSRPWYKGLCTY